MKNYVLMLVLLMVSISSAGIVEDGGCIYPPKDTTYTYSYPPQNPLSTTAYPIFSGSRSPWWDYVTRGNPIVVDSHSTLGLTNPGLGKTPYHFKFEVVFEDVSFITDNVEVDNYGIAVTFSKTLIIEGVHIGAGNPIDGIQVVGNGIVNIYERQYNTLNEYDYLGYFTVGTPIPEPASIMLLGCGFWGLFCSAKKRKL